jgi:nicotinamide riboside transporter PnuC
MNRFRALLKNTWWLWLLFAVVTVILFVLVGGVALAIVPICVFTFFYFAFVRYDEKGNHRENIR